MNRTRKTLVLAQVAFRSFNTTTAKSAEAVSPRFQKLKEVQKKFGIEDNVPVYLKGGATDKLLYAATSVVTFIGLGMSFQTFYDLIRK